MASPQRQRTLNSVTTTIDWPAATFEALKRLEVRQVGYVPDAGHKRLIELCHADGAIRPAVLTTEEEGIGLACGAWLGGERAVLLMQSSGVGNCVNGFAMVKACGLPFLTLITMRGQWGEFNPWQVPMGQTTPEMLRLAGLAVYPVETAEEVAPTVEAAGRLAFNSRVGVAVLIGQRLIGSKSFSR
jgi:sulfopyruvate decarboxylase alpha subunit